MENEQMISLTSLSRHYNIEVSFIRSLEDYGLIEIVEINNEPCLDKDCLGDVEKMMRMHYDLEINMAGIDAISHLLARMHRLQDELRELKNKSGRGLF